MLIAIDFDNTIARRTGGAAPNDMSKPMELVPGAKAGLLALRRAGHKLILFSSRSNVAYRKDWTLNPVWRNPGVEFDKAKWEAQRTTSEDLHHEMVGFVKLELPAIDDGLQGKPVVDLFIDDRAFRVDTRRAWRDVELLYGDPEEVRRREA
jgi:hypothetical protein